MAWQDAYWAAVDAALAAARQVRTVDELITALNKHHPPSVGDAFFAGSGGDEQLWDAIMDNPHGWRVVWAEADYYWVARDPEGNLCTYVEGDVYRGDTRPAAQEEGKP